MTLKNRHACRPGMRALWTVLLLLPLAGCLGDGESTADVEPDTPPAPPATAWHTDAFSGTTTVVATPIVSVKPVGIAGIEDGGSVFEMPDLTTRAHVNVTVSGLVPTASYDVLLYAPRCRDVDCPLRQTTDGTASFLIEEPVRGEWAVTVWADTPGGPLEYQGTLAALVAET